MELDLFFEIHQKATEGVSPTFKRYLFSEIEWQERLIGIVGPRGVGKTTLLLQHYLEKYGSVKKCLYVSCDQVQFSNIGIFNLGKEYFQMGGEALIFDEIHKYPLWTQEIKNLTDVYKNKKILLSGSSSIAFSKGIGDLSRRVAPFSLHGLSFREYLNLTQNVHFDPVSLGEIIENHIEMSEKICKVVQPLPEFKKYLKSGYYPFFLEGEKTFQQKLMNVIEKVISEDIPTLFSISQAKIPTLRKMLWLVASSPPFSPNIEKISSGLNLSKEYTYKFFEYLQTAGLMQFLRSFQKSHKLVRKPEKIFIADPNLLESIVGSIQLEGSVGAVRETFFLNQVKLKHSVFSHPNADFQVDNLVFEVGGPSKDGNQIVREKNAFLVLDQQEHGYKNRIPLYLFGFLY